MRIRLKKLTKQLSESEIKELHRRMGENVGLVYDGYVALRKSGVGSLDSMIQDILDELFERAEREGVRLKASEHKGYFPYFYTYTEGNWDLVKQKELEAFLLRYLDGAKVLRLFSLAERRNNALVLWGHLHRFLVDVQIVEEEKS